MNCVCLWFNDTACWFCSSGNNGMWKYWRNKQLFPEEYKYFNQFFWNNIMINSDISWKDSIHINKILQGFLSTFANWFLRNIIARKQWNLQHIQVFSFQSIILLMKTSDVYTFPWRWTNPVASRNATKTDASLV